MTETRELSQAEEVERERFQFGLGRILVLTTVSAVAAAIAASMEAPLVFQAIVAGYLILMATYIVLRLPAACRGIMRRTPQWERLRRRRSDLEATVLRMKRDTEQARLSASTDKSQAPSSAAPPGPHETS